MYAVDDRDRVTKLVGVPLVMSDGLTVVVAHYLENAPSEWHGSWARMVDLCLAHQFGPPNDEGFDGHPLAGRGLERCGAFEIIGSSWVRRLEEGSIAGLVPSMTTLFRWGAA